jgi:hypothetical protein
MEDDRIGGRIILHPLTRCLLSMSDPCLTVSLVQCSLVFRKQCSCSRRHSQFWLQVRNHRFLVISFGQALNFLILNYVIKVVTLYGLLYNYEYISNLMLIGWYNVGLRVRSVFFVFLGVHLKYGYCIAIKRYKHFSYLRIHVRNEQLFDVVNFYEF